NYESFLVKQKILDKKSQDGLRKQIKEEIEEGLERAFAEKHPVAATDVEVNDVYAPYIQKVVEPSSGKQSERRYIDAISDGLKLSMRKHPDLVLMGQDIAEYGGVFKITEGLVSEFGKERVRNTPICESAIVGTALGLSI